MQQMKGCLTCLPAKAGWSENPFTDSCERWQRKAGTKPEQSEMVDSPPFNYTKK
jgi:hypothetical protein